MAGRVSVAVRPSWKVSREYRWKRNSGNKVVGEIQQNKINGRVSGEVYELEKSVGKRGGSCQSRWSM